jgi:K+-sensing histidine kinase KdpD
VETSASASPVRARIRLRLNGAAGIWTLSIAIGSIAALLGFVVLRGFETMHLSFRIAWPVLAALFALAEAFVIHVQFRRGDAHSFSLNEVPLVLGLFFTAPAGVMLAQCVGAAAALIFVRRQQPIKVAFNVAHLTVESGIAVAVFAATRTVMSAIVPADWFAALGAAILAAFTGAMFVGVAISMSQGRPSPKLVARNLAFALTTAACNASLALAAATVLARDSRSVWLLVAPIVVVFFSYRAYSRQRERHESLRLLYESTRTLQHAATVEGALRTLLDQTRSMFRAEVASVTFFPTADEPALRTTLGPGDRFSVLQPLELDPREGVWARVAAENSALLFARPIRNERLRTYFEGRGMRDAMVAPVTGDTGVVGTLVVGNRLGDVSTFDEDDLRLFETLANHASTSLQKVRLVSRLEDALAHQTELNRLKDDFVATVSHELRTPLTSIQGFVHTMLRPDVDFAPEERREFLGVIDRQTKRLGRMIEDLLVVARIETHKVRPSALAVSMPSVINEAINDIGGRNPDHNVVTTISEEVQLVISDHEMIYRIVANLVDNAFKYSPQGTKIAVTAEASGHGVKVSVSDEGSGVPDPVRERIFDRFFQADQSHTRAVGGAGLGLYICRQLAGVLRGRIWLEETGENGSTFSLWIPDSYGEIIASASPSSN